MHNRQPDTRPADQHHRGIFLLEQEYAAAAGDPARQAELRGEIRRAGYPVIADELDKMAGDL